MKSSAEHCVVWRSGDIWPVRVNQMQVQKERPVHRLIELLFNFMNHESGIGNAVRWNICFLEKLDEHIKSLVEPQVVIDSGMIDQGDGSITILFQALGQRIDSLR